MKPFPSQTIKYKTNKIYVFEPTNVFNRNDLDEELEEKVVDEGRRRGHRHCAVDLFNLLTEMDPQDMDAVVDGKELNVFLED